MRIRSLILFIMIMSYGNLMGHEIVFGHHTTDEINCHHHGPSCCDHNGEQNDHIPCLVNVNPHFVSSQDVYVPHIEEFEQDQFVLLINILQIDFHSYYCREVPPRRIPSEEYSSPYHRSQGLRGPPLS